jgi:Carboxypeptidase regulatory-like domain/TonB dependent receptor
VKDPAAAAMSDVTVKIHNIGTNLDITVQTQSNGSYAVNNLPVGDYELTFSKSGFETEKNTQITVQGDRTSTVDAALKVGTVSTVVEVTSESLMNQTDTTNGYVVDQLTIENTPLGTGSFTQLAIMAPGVHADFLGGSGANTGLGNTNIYSNGQRSTSNSFSLNGINTNNLFNGNSSSQVGENRFVLNEGENFGAGGAIQTSTSVTAAIGQALPTPAPETIQEIAVNAAMFDASQGANSGAHISVITKSGTNSLHGDLYEHFQNSAMNAAPFFYNADPAITVKDPFMARNAFGATLGGPIKKDKLFFFISYQGVRIADASTSSETFSVPISLTNNRTPAGIIAAEQQDFGTTLTASQLSPVSMALMSATLPNGSYLIPTPNITNIAQAKQIGGDVFLQGPNVQAQVNQGSGNIDYLISSRDRLAFKYYYQNDPTTSPFGYENDALGFPQQLQAGSQVVSFDNTVVLAPNLTWQQRAGFTRMLAYGSTSQPFTASSVGINLPGGDNVLPYISITKPDETLGGTLHFGASPSFANVGMYQNQWEYGTSLGWVKGRHNVTFGFNWAHTQLNIVNNNTSSSELSFSSFANFLEGTIKTSANASTLLLGTADRGYRSDTGAAFINDNFKVKSNLTLTLGLRWDNDGALSEKHGLLTAFNAADYGYNAGTDTITGSGLEVASNNPTFGTQGAGDTLMKNPQWGFAPRIGLAWNPTSKLTVRTGFGMYYDRGEFFSELSPSAGGGFNGPFGVTLAPPFVNPIAATSASTFQNPFPGAVSPPPNTPAQFLAELPNLTLTNEDKQPAGNLFGPFLFGGYDINNKLPYTENWTFDLQYQFANSWMLSAGYVGNHGVHGVIPIPFNQPLVATPTNPVNGQTSSYGYTYPTSNTTLEPLDTQLGGNTNSRVPYIGYSPNSVIYEAEGVSNYNALQIQLRKRLSFGLQLTASYTWSHSLDDQSAEGLFYTGNNPLNPKSGYASSDFDQTHVFLINYLYQIPKVTSNKALGYAINGWTIGGQTVAQSGQPYSVYDYSGSIGSIFYSSDDEITNPIVGLAPGVTTKQAQLQGTTGVNAGKPVLNVNDFQPQFLAPGQDGVPAGDVYESAFGTLGRNTFRAPFGVRFDATLGKNFQLNERFRLRFSFDAFNIFNHPNFDAPNNDVDFFSGFAPPVLATPTGTLGVIQHTIGSPRFLQLNLRLSF